ncbi:MAG TPA: GNAT family N-acetyltransferase [Anaerolineales bacterium]|nr:GNAT family N-acetyltransferase [Anaerolineales bacterium]
MVNSLGAKILETPRTYLRRQVPGDLDALWELYCDPQVTRYIPDAPRSREEARDELEWFMNGHPAWPELGLWATILKADGSFIGRCGLLPWNVDGQEEVEVAYTIAREYWGRGLGSEVADGILRYAFDELRLERLISLIDPENTASQRVAVKIGMRLESKLDGINGDGIATWIYAAKRAARRRNHAD